jgi:hypothetical protein
MPPCTWSAPPSDGGDACDNCIKTYSFDQTDSDGDNIGDICDNCLDDQNSDQLDNDATGSCSGPFSCPYIFDETDCKTYKGPAPSPACTWNVQTDGGNSCDNCPDIFNLDQADSNGNEVGDVCDDGDMDGIIDIQDNCPTVSNPDQADSELTPESCYSIAGSDYDTFCNAIADLDSCGSAYFGDQENGFYPCSWGASWIPDGVGDACDCGSDDGLCTAQNYCAAQNTPDPNCESCKTEKQTQLGILSLMNLTNKDDKARLGDAIKALNKSIVEQKSQKWKSECELYCPYEVSPKANSKKVFYDEEKAVKKLMEIRNWASNALINASIVKITDVDKLLAQKALTANPTCNTVKANTEMTAAIADYNAKKYKDAIHHYKKVWELSTQCMCKDIKYDAACAANLETAWTLLGQNKLTDAMKYEAKYYACSGLTQ